MGRASWHHIPRQVAAMVGDVCLELSFLRVLKRYAQAVNSRIEIRIV